MGAHSDHKRATSMNNRHLLRPLERDPEIKGRSIGGSVGPPATKAEWEELKTNMGELEETGGRGK